jgi:hypothetical protein
MVCATSLTLAAVVGWGIFRSRQRWPQYAGADIFIGQDGGEADGAGAITQGALPDVDDESQRLRNELERLHYEIAESRQQAEMFKIGEREALERHDKPALDAVWAEHDSLLEHLYLLEHHEEETLRALTRQVELALERWRGEAELQVQRWREERQHAVEAIDDRMRGIEGIVAGLQGWTQREAQERGRLLAELEQLQPGDLPVHVAQPDVDWAVPGSDLAAVADRLNQLAEACRQIAAPPASESGTAW